LWSFEGSPDGGKATRSVLQMSSEESLKRDQESLPNAPPWGLAWRLAIGQVVAWGVLFYSFSVIVGPMQADTSWSRPFLNGGLSIGLITWGVCALPVGAWIKQRGGRGLMAGGSLVGGSAFIAMSFVTLPGLYLICWVFVGMAMAAILYEPAFAIATAAFGQEFRRGITLITLVAGLASTLFIPAAQFAVETIGWRGALAALGSVLILIDLPLHFWGIPVREAIPVSEVNMLSTTRRFGIWFHELFSDMRDRRFLGLALWFTAHTAMFSGMTFLLVPMLQGASVEPRTYLSAIVLIGPMQVLARLALASRGNRFSALQSGRLAMAALFIAMLSLVLFDWSLFSLIIFAICYGAGNGVMTILKGTSVAELFGHARYSELNGAIAAPAALSMALSPIALSALWSISGDSSAVIISAIGLLLFGTLGMALASSRSPHFRLPNDNEP